MIPNDGAVYDLSRSMVRFYLKAGEPIEEVHSPDEVVDWKMRYNKSPLAIFNHSLVQYTEIKTQNQGTLTRAATTTA